MTDFYSECRGRISRGTKMLHRHGGDIYSCLAGQDLRWTAGQDMKEIYGRILDFSANINFRGMPESVRQAAEQAVRWSEHYPDTDYRTLRAALARREKRLSAQEQALRKTAESGAAAYTGPDTGRTDEICPEQIICGNGAAELMFALTAAYRPRRALLAVPSFFEYEQALRAFGCAVQHFYLPEALDYRLDESFVNEIGEETDCVILGNPNNPTGQLIGGRLLEQIVSRCREREILLVLDESFCDFLSAQDRGRTFTGAREIPGNRHLFVMRSFTKIYAMPGLRFGYGICGDPALLEKMRTVLQPWNVSVPAQAAAECAAAETAYAAETAQIIQRNREQMACWMQDAGYRVFPSNTNFLMFCGPEGLKEFCLKKGFLIRDCSNFPGLGKGFYRICIRSEAENASLMQVLAEAGGRLKNAEIS